MMRSLFSGVTGLRNHQTRMDVIGNNIANVNTVGFKRSTVTFSDLFSETMSPASGATANTGGVNPKQIGLGMQVSSIKQIHTRGSAQYTGGFLDFFIEGDGFFIVDTPDGPRFTRDGSFNMDNVGNLVTNSGDFVLGYPTQWRAPGVGDPEWPGGFDADTANGTQDLQPITIPYEFFTSVAVGENGEVVGQVKGGVYYDPVAGFNTASTGVALADGANIKLGYVALANFVNPAGLEKTGNNYYTNTPNSGPVQLGQPKSEGFGGLKGSTLEMSNVDLAEEFVNMIVTQRGLQANSRIITTSDSILEELVNLKR